MTPRVPLVCTPEELGELLFWSGEVAVEIYRLRIGGDNHDTADYAKARRDDALAALFRPAEEPDMPDHPMPLNDNVRKALEETINRHSRENRSDTPDFLLADYLLGCLETFESVTRARDAWHGFKPFGGANTVPAPAAPPPAGEPARCRDCGGPLSLEDVAEGLTAHAYTVCIAALRAENERLRGELEAKA